MTESNKKLYRKPAIAMICWLLFIFINETTAESYLLNGGQESQIQYELIQQVQPTAGTRQLYLNFVVPQTFESPTYSQQVSNVQYDFRPEPDKKEAEVDQRGNKILKAIWNNPRTPIKTTISLTAQNQTRLQKLNTAAPFPNTRYPQSVSDYLKATAQVQSSDVMIAARAKELTRGAKTQFDAVQRILTWVIDHMHYVLTPPQYDAKYSFQTGKGNCQNYSHLSAALMRSVGIPVRIVNGVTLNRPYEIETGRGTLTMKMAQGRHSWIEVYFDDLKWVPFDPQQTQLFVSNRFLRVEIGVDNDETKNDGLIRWSQARGASGRPKFEEIIEGNFSRDVVKFDGKQQEYGPQKLLLTPFVETTFIPYTPKVEEPPPPPKIDSEKLKTLRYRKSFVFGNLDFPIRIDFSNVRGPVETRQDNQFEMKKNFLVETAEYVTSKDQYAQIFILQKPVQLKKVSLALHKFGGDGMLWLEIYKDKNGIPGDRIATSEFISVPDLKFGIGYDWQVFDFSREALTLAPGSYWIALGFTGSPIINWFYSYGKPIGPEYGTRYKTVLEPNWSKALSFEFNYRIEGFTTE